LKSFANVIHTIKFVKAISISNIDANHIILSLYIDDMIMIGDDIDDISVLKTKLVRQFEMKDLSYLQYFMDIEVARSLRGTFFLNQKILQIFLNNLDLLTIRL